MAIGLQGSTPCINPECSGILIGTYAGNFDIGIINYRHILNATCNACGLKESDVFDCYDCETGECWITNQVEVFIDEFDLINEYISDLETSFDEL